MPWVSLEMQRCSAIRSFPTLHVSRTVIFWNVLMKAGYTLENLPAYGRATRSALSFSLTPDSQLRVSLICMFFLDKEDELTARSTGKGLTVAPRDQTMTLLVRRSKLKYRRQLKFLFHFVWEFSLCTNWRRSNLILGNGDLFILLYYWFIWQLLNRISRIWHTLLPYTGLTTCSHLDKLDTHQFHH